MNSTERRKQLLKLLDREGTLSLIEMVDYFGVSKMTIHRDLVFLEERKALKRIHGGAAKLEQSTATSPADPFQQLSQLHCLICNRPPTQQLLYILTMKNGDRKVACCPHCGISAHLMLENEVAMALTADFLSGKLHSAQHSYFNMGGVVDYCCKPAVLTFDNEEMALRFEKGFGGTTGRFNDALDYLKKDISMHSADGCPHCAPQQLILK
jgi:DeoR family transcriptional regulator, copper-sensing transcriptional repressor